MGITSTNLVILAGFLACTGQPACAADAAPLSPAQAPQLADDGRHLLWLGTGVVDVDTLPNSLHSKRFADAVQVIVLDGPMTPARQKDLTDAGVRLASYLPMNAFIADVSKTTPARVAALGFVAWAGEYRGAWKLDPALLHQDVRAWKEPSRQAAQKRGERFVSIWHFDGKSADSTMKQLVGARVVYQESVAGEEVLYALVPQRRLAALASIKEIRYVEEVGEFSPRSTTTTRWVVQSNVDGVTPLYSAGITGAGQLVGVIDDPIGITHCAFLDAVNQIGPLHRKVEAYNATPTYSSHGTEVAGVLCGDAGANDDTRGVAYGARLIYASLPVLDEPSASARMGLVYSQGARVLNNSWGDDNTIQYNGPCRAIDNLCYSNDDQLQVFAVTNFATLRNPENSKNCLAVSASRNAPTQDIYCGGGIGPTSDGRRKPEITAPGCNIASAGSFGGCGVLTNSGTSLAAPAISGVATLVRDYLTSGFYPSGVETPGDAFTPSGALLKAIVLNSGADMNGLAGYPGNQEGWGRALLDASLFLPGFSRSMVLRDVRNGMSTLTTGGSVETFVAVTAPNEPLRCTLVFHDAPALNGATFAPVNNLDLQAIAPDGTIFRGNVFQNGVSTPGGAADAINNVEQILIPQPLVGRWRVRAVGAAVNQGPQGFALVTTGAVTDVACAADLDDGSGLGHPDAGVDISDLLYFLAQFEGGAPIADVDDGSMSGRPDQGVDISDLLFFLARFEVGC